ITIQVFLARVVNGRTVVGVVINAVVVRVRGAGVGVVAGIRDAGAVAVLLQRIAIHRAVVITVGNLVIVVVAVADIANAIRTDITLLMVRVVRPVVAASRDPVGILAIGTGVADAIAIRIGLVGIREARARVDR